MLWISVCVCVGEPSNGQRPLNNNKAKFCWKNWEFLPTRIHILIPGSSLSQSTHSCRLHFVAGLTARDSIPDNNSTTSKWLRYFAIESGDLPSRSSLPLSARALIRSSTISTFPWLAAIHKGDLPCASIWSFCTPALIKKRATSNLSWSAAIHRGDLPCRSTLSLQTPALINTFTTSTWPCEVATSNGVFPSRSSSLLSARAPIKSCTTSPLACWQASERGGLVAPDFKLFHCINSHSRRTQPFRPPFDINKRTSQTLAAPAWSNTRTILSKPLVQAVSIGVVPRKSAVSAEALASTRSSATSQWPSLQQRCKGVSPSQFSFVDHKATREKPHAKLQSTHKKCTSQAVFDSCVSLRHVLSSLDW